MGVSVRCCDEIVDIERKVDSFCCGYSYWNTIKRDIVEAAKRYIHSKEQIGKELGFALDNTIEGDVVLKFIIVGDKYSEKLKEIDMRGIYLLVNSSDVSHIFSEEEVIEIGISIKKIMTYVSSSNKEDIIKVGTIFNKSGKSRKRVIIC